MATGTPLILLHGFPMTKIIWHPITSCFVVPVHFRGFGPVSADAPFSIDELADDVHHTLVQLNARRAGKPCALGGLSMGGYVALSLADRYPDDISALVLFDTKATADDSAAKAKRDEMIDLARTGGTAAITAAMESKLLSPTATDDVRDQFRAMANRIPIQTLVWALVAMRDRPDRTAVLSRIAVPTLCAVGEHDAATPPAVVDDMRRQIPTAEPLAVIPGAGHIPPLENPAATAAVLRAFMDRFA